MIIRNQAYSSRRKNEYRIDAEDCMKMSELTNTILDGVDYDFIKEKRRNNDRYLILEQDITP